MRGITTPATIITAPTRYRRKLGGCTSISRRSNEIKHYSEEIWRTDRKNLLIGPDLGRKLESLSLSLSKFKALKFQSNAGHGNSAQSASHGPFMGPFTAVANWRCLIRILTERMGYKSGPARSWDPFPVSSLKLNISSEIIITLVP